MGTLGAEEEEIQADPMARMRPPIVPDKPVPIVAEDALKRLFQVCAGNSLEGLDAPAWERTGRHGQHGTMSAELYETHVAAEVVDHLAQIARLR